MQPAMARQNGRGVWLYKHLPATASQISSLQQWRPFFADSSLTLRSAAEAPQEVTLKSSAKRWWIAQSESGFYSRYFLVPKKDGGLLPILDLRLLNYTLMKRSFRLITLKQILLQIWPGDWFMSLDLKDTFFHIQVAPHHRRFLRFTFEWMAYQYKVLPFALSLAPCTFTRSMDAALSPLQQMGIRILNYLDDFRPREDLQALSVNPVCLEFRPNDSKVILKPLYEKDNF